MASKSSDTDSTTITELETTESTETYSNEEDDSQNLEEEFDSDSSEEEEEDSCESDQVWGVDSFDDTDYETDEDDDDFVWKRYLCHVYHSKGFKVDREVMPDRPYIGVRPFNFNGSFLTNVDSREYMDNMVKLSLDRYNKENGTSVMLDHVVRVVVKLEAGIKSYITFMARDSHGDLVEYQAKTQWRVWQRNAHAILCRPAPPMKPIPQKYLPIPRKIKS